MVKQYCKGKTSSDEKFEFADGSSISGCKKARSVFYATMREHGWDEKKSRPKATEETIEWYLQLLGVKKK